jgi:putative hydrolase of the HAD superfamily
VDDPRDAAGQTRPQAPDVARRFRGLITDWGGVLTSSIPAAVRAWLDSDDIDPDAYAAAVRPWRLAGRDPAGDGNPVHALERGEYDSVEFEQGLASILVRRDGGRVPAEGLLGRMFAASVPSQQMYAAVHALRMAGLSACMLSNSWGHDAYPREVFDGMFDAVVISAQVGMRKPEERIYRYATELIGLPPAECVFVDDMEANVRAAEALGMCGIVHTQPEATVARLAELFGLPLG